MLDSGRTVDPNALRIDLDAAGRMLARLADMRSRARALIMDAVELDHPLNFGDSWVAQLMAGQLRGAGAEHDRGLTPALRAFHGVLDELEDLVRSCTDQYRRCDDAAVAGLNRAGREVAR